MSARLTGTYSNVGGATFGGGEAVAQAWDNNTGSKLCNTNFGGAFWMVADLGALYLLTSTYDIYSANDASERDPKNWTLQGSTDNTNWVTLDTVSNHGTWASRQAKETFTSDQIPSAYRYYRWNCTAVQSGSIMQISEFQIFGDVARYINTSYSGSGSITPGDVYVAHGSNKTFTITPDADYKISQILAGGVSQEITNENGMDYTFTNVTADTTLAVTFVLKAVVTENYLVLPRRSRYLGLVSRP